RKIQTEEHFLSEASRILGSSLDYSDTLRTVVRLAVPQIADWCALHLEEEGRGIVTEVAHADPEKMAYVRQLQDRFPPKRDRSSGVYYVMKSGKSELYPEIPDTLLQEAAYGEEHLDLLR